MPYGKSVPVPKGWSISYSGDNEAKARETVARLRKEGKSAKVASGIAHSWSGAGYREYLAIYKNK